MLRNGGLMPDEIEKYISRKCSFYKRGWSRLNTVLREIPSVSTIWISSGSHGRGKTNENGNRYLQFCARNNFYS